MRELEDLRNTDDGDSRRERPDASGADDAGGVAGEAGAGVERMVVKQRLGREEERDHDKPG